MNTPNDNDRLYIFKEQHIGIGIRWARNWNYQLDISIALPFFTVVIGIGKRVN